MGDKSADPEDTSAVPEEKSVIPTTSKLPCSHCVCTFGKKSSLYKHMRKFHPEQTLDMPHRNKVCGICDARFGSLVQLQKHTMTDHAGDVELSVEKKTFYTVEDFEDWKAVMERNSQSHFVKRVSDKLLADGTVASYYVCHRSGCYEPKQVRKRRLKAAGTNKIGRTCPAIIKVRRQTIEEVTEIKVEYQSVHVGHEMEVERIPLSKPEKIQLAAQLSQGVPKSTILTELSETQSPTKRLGLTRRRDLLNICRDYGIRAQDNDAGKVRKTTRRRKRDENLPSVENSDDAMTCGGEPLTNDADEPQSQEVVAIIYVDEQQQQHKAGVASEPMETPPVLAFSDVNNATEFDQRKAVVVSKLQMLLSVAESAQSSGQLRVLEDAVSVLEGRWVTTLLSSGAFQPVHLASQPALLEDQQQLHLANEAAVGKPEHSTPITYSLSMESNAIC